MVVSLSRRANLVAETLACTTLLSLNNVPDTTLKFVFVDLIRQLGFRISTTADTSVVPGCFLVFVCGFGLNVLIFDRMGESLSVRTVAAAPT